MLRSRFWTAPSVWWLGLPAAAVVAVAVKAPQLRSANDVRSVPQEVTARRIAYVHPEAVRYAEPRPLPSAVTAAGVPLSDAEAAVLRSVVAAEMRQVSGGAPGDEWPAAEPLVPPADFAAQPEPWVGPAVEEQGAAAAWTLTTDAALAAERPAPELVNVDGTPPGPVLEERQPVLELPPVAMPEGTAEDDLPPPPSDWSAPPSMLLPPGQAAPSEESPSDAAPSDAAPSDAPEASAVVMPAPTADLPSSEELLGEEPPAEAPLADRQPQSLAPQLPPGLPPYEALHEAAPNEPAPRVPALPVLAPQSSVPMHGVARRFAAPPADPLAVLPRVSDAALREQIEQHLAAGYKLAQRGALYSAKREFETALRVVAQSHDVVAGTTQRTQQLAAALSAIEEADEFFVSDPRTHAVVSVQRLAAAHRTPVLRDPSMADATPIEAMQAYYGFAQAALHEAVGGQPAAAQALYGLGKIYAALAKQPAEHNGRLLGAKALLMYQVAVSTDARHHLAANELGVMLARYGQYGEAKKALLQSVSLQSLPQSWHNLAVVHRQLGEHPLAELAEIESQAAAERLKAQARPLLVAQEANTGLQWIDVEEAMRQATQAAPASPDAAEPAPGPGPAPGDRSASESNSMWNWLPWKTTQR